MYYRLNYKTATKEVRLESGAEAAPAAIGGWTDGGTFRHDHSTDALGNNPEVAPDARFGENHTLFHHIQAWADLAFGRKDKKTYDLSRWVIQTDTLRSLSIGAGGIAVAVGADSANLTATPTPANASLAGLVWTTSDATKATLVAGTTGYQRKVHGVAAGTSNIAANIGSITATARVATVTAP